MRYWVQVAYRRQWYGPFIDRARAAALAAAVDGTVIAAERAAIEQLAAEVGGTVINRRAD